MVGGVVSLLCQRAEKEKGGIGGGRRGGTSAPLQPLFGGGNRATRSGEALYGDASSNKVVWPPVVLGEEVAHGRMRIPATNLNAAGMLVWGSLAPRISLKTTVILYDWQKGRMLLDALVMTCEPTWCDRERNWIE